MDAKIILKTEIKSSRAEYTSDVDSCDSSDKYFKVYSANTRCGYLVKDQIKKQESKKLDLASYTGVLNRETIK
jgi:hypothetical protein